MTRQLPPGTLAAGRTGRPRCVNLDAITNVRDHVRGQAGKVLRAEFDDCEVTVGPDTTTLRAELPDGAALTGLVRRITGLGLDLIDLHLVTSAADDRGPGV